MNSLIALLLAVASGVLPAFAREFHVAPAGNDPDPGSAARPWRPIAAAAQRAQPGDVITIHQGVYRSASPRPAEARPTASASFTRPRGEKRSKSKAPRL